MPPSLSLSTFNENSTRYLTRKQRRVVIACARAHSHFSASDRKIKQHERKRTGNRNIVKTVDTAGRGKSSNCHQIAVPAMKRFCFLRAAGGGELRDRHGARLYRPGSPASCHVHAQTTIRVVPVLQQSEITHCEVLLILDCLLALAAASWAVK
jgi:hypothetical protein